MILSVVVISFYKPELTIKCVHSILSNEVLGGVEAIVIDNCSNDAVVKELLKLRTIPGVTLVFNSENLYFGKASNVGMNLARGKYILITNNDVIYEKGSLQGYVDSFEKYKDVGLLGVGGGYIKDDFELDEITSRNGDEMFGYSNVQNFDFYEIDFVAGFSMLIERKFANDNNIRFDENFRLYWEDVDISNQVRKLGKKCIMMSKKHIPYKHLRSATITPLCGVEKREEFRKESFDYYRKKWPKKP